MIRSEEAMAALSEQMHRQLRQRMPEEHHVLFAGMQLQQTDTGDLRCLFDPDSLLLIRGFYGKELRQVLHQAAPGASYELGSLKERPQGDSATASLGMPSAFFVDHTFENFVATGSNLFAMHAATEVVRNLREGHLREGHLREGQGGNSLLLYGACGVGKTHLLHSIAHEVQRHCPKQRLCYEPANNFLQRMTAAMRTRDGAEIERFRAHYRQVDVLLLDDLHHLEDKKRTQEELLWIHNNLMEGRNSLVVYASGKEPAELVGRFNPQLRSRLGRSMMAHLTYPETGAIKEILRRRIARYEDACCAREWPQDCCDYLARSIRDVRDLEGCLQQILCYARAHEASAIDLSLVKEAVASRLQPPVTLSKKQVLKVVCKHYNVDYDHMLTKSRQKRVTRARHVAMYLCRQLLGDSYPEIGIFFGGKDHSTVMHACKRVTQLQKEDTDFDKQLEALTRQLTNPGGA